MAILIVDGREHEVDPEIFHLIDAMFQDTESLRLRICVALGLDYAIATDQGILDAIEMLKRSVY